MYFTIHSCGCCWYLQPHLHILSGYIKLWRQFPFICVTTRAVLSSVWVSERTQTIHRVQISSQHRNRAFLRSQPITRDVNNSIHSKRDDGQEQENIFFFSDVVSFYFNYPQLFRLHLTPFIASQLSSGIQSGENIYIYSITTSPSPCLANSRKTFIYSFFKLQITCLPNFSRGPVWSAWRSSAPWSTGSRTAGSRSTRRRTLSRPRRISMFLKYMMFLFTYIYSLRITLYSWRLDIQKYLLVTYVHKTQWKAKFIQDNQ